MVKTLTDKEIWERKQEFDFTNLLVPYRCGGTEDSPVQRTMGTIVDYLVNKKRYPIDVVGASILLTFFELKGGKVFKGDGSYGSPGRELITYIRQTCDGISQGKLKTQVYKSIAEARVQELQEFIAGEITRQTTPFWKKWFRRNDEDVVPSPVAKFFGG